MCRQQKVRNYKYIFSNKMESRRKQQGKLDQKLDEQFVNVLTVIENNYLIFNRHIQIRVEKWVEKLLQYDQNTVWRKIRNNYLKLLKQMVLNKKIDGVFLKMPPEGDLPAIFEAQHKKIVTNPGKQTHVLSHQISIKKIQEAGGDAGSMVATPICDTGRQLCVDNGKYKQDKQNNPEQGTKRGNAHMWQKINNFLIKNHEKLKKDKQYYELVIGLNSIWNGASKQTNTVEDESADFKVEEGIEANKINLFQFGSPRGMTQMQYFKAALQL